ncbi:WW domain binding protein 11-domain-containing protein [Diplogelasinospora grovesii]|uniref:WW domain binding protein 11-domain-containing protein n=1 Tax=Diplogelasinospora grovesii TaxID=303347 RepID=A0AAN6S3E3_9PEZI|nr:WW domain binding protein 11-domain-containing protein [Diplogelasinospora grovesii]
MPKERNFNPVQAQRKAEKAKAIKKGKAELQARRNEKLATRNPERIQQQINDLKALKEDGGKLTAIEEQSLEALEKDLKAVKKAREALGDKAPAFSERRGPPRQGGGRDDKVLGKRRRDAEDDNDSSASDVPEDVRTIPMPRDTPPPIPKEMLDEWYAKRRARRNNNSSANAANANEEPLGDNRRVPGQQETSEDNKPAAAPAVEAKVVYEAKPVIRDLKKEAVSAFMPTVVRMKIEKGKGQGGLLEPEEADELEKAGYLKTTSTTSTTSTTGRASLQRQSGDGDAMELDHGAAAPPGRRKVTMEEVEDDDG